MRAAPCLCALACTAAAALGCAGLGGSEGSLEELRADSEARRQAARDLDDPEPLPSVEEQLEEADRMRDAGRLEQALWTYLEAVRRDPAAAKPRERIGYLQLTRDVERAEAIFTSLVREDPRDASAYRGLGLARLARGRHREAREALERSTELDARSPLAEYALAVVNDLLGDHEQALERALRARALAPDHAGIANTVGVCQLVLGDPTAAEHSFREAIRLDPRIETFQNNLGLALARQGRLEEAARAFERGGDRQAALNNLGFAHYLNGDYEQAIVYYERALAEEGESKSVVLRNLRRAVEAREETGGRSPVPGDAP